MKTLRTSPVLRSRAKTGKAKFWRISLLTDLFGDSGMQEFYLQKTWWQDGTVEQSSTPERVLGKNIGRTNATSDRAQADLAFDRTVQKRRDKGFSEDGSAEHVYIKPMLAHKFVDHARSLKFPVFVQPKLDGFRMLMDGDEAWTRGGKDHVRECIQHLMWDVSEYGNYIIDGELLLPGNKPLQVSASAAKKYQRGVSDTLEYLVYDLIDLDEPNLPFSERTALVYALFANKLSPASKIPANVKLVPTLLAKDEEEVMKAHAIFVQYGYEGSIIRTTTGRYEMGYRSHGLLKLKDFQDAEFQVVGVEHGKGSFEDKAKLRLAVDPAQYKPEFDDRNDPTFTAVPAGFDDYRRSLWTNRSTLIGQWWTIRYQTLSLCGKPIFPVAVAPRSKEDR